MSRKVIIDCDPGIDDALALCLALWDPRIELLAATACAGTVDAQQATENLFMLVERLDPPLLPRLGMATDPEIGAAAFNGALLHGEKGLGAMTWQPVSRQHNISSDKLIIDQLRSHPGEVTIVCTGPLTNLAKALGRDPAIAPMIDHIIIAGGTLLGKGNVTPCAEFNFHFDPKSARTVLNSLTTKTIIPLEISQEFSFGWELVDRLPSQACRPGALLRELIPYLIRSVRQQLGQETASFQALAAILAVLDSDILDCEERAADVEPMGEMTRGALIFDQRQPQQWKTNAEVAVGLDCAEAESIFFNSLRYVGASRK